MAFDMLMKLTAGALQDRCMLGYVPGVTKCVVYLVADQRGCVLALLWMLVCAPQTVSVCRVSVELCDMLQGAELQVTDVRPCDQAPPVTGHTQIQ